MSDHSISIRNCDFKFRCSQRWSSLESTQNATQRFCTDCNKAVVLCETQEELYRAIEADQCVAVKVDQPPRGASPTEEVFITVGVVEAPYRAVNSNGVPVDEADTNSAVGKNTKVVRRSSR